MITRDEVMPLFEEACPSFAVIILRSGPVPTDALDAMGRLAHHVVDLAAGADAEELPAVFHTLDRVLVEGDHDAVALVRTGFVEDLQNITSHRDVSVEPGELAALLEPVGAAVWEELDRAWVDAGARAGVDHPRIPAEDYLLLGREDRRRLQSMTRELPDGTLARPSDVLRYEVEQLDQAMERRRRLSRSVALWFLALALLSAALVVLLA